MVLNCMRIRSRQRRVLTPDGKSEMFWAVEPRVCKVLNGIDEIACFLY